MLYLLIFLNGFWSLAAMWVDFAKLSIIPFYLWPFVLICPIYPALLLLVYISYLKNKAPNPFLLALAVIPSAVFGLLALIYYPSQIYYNGFSWNDFGQIFWVLFYSVQGWYLLFKEKFQSVPIIVTLAYLIIKFSIDYKYQTFGYLQIKELPGQAQFYIFVVAFISTLVISVYKLSRR